MSNLYIVQQLYRSYDNVVFPYIQQDSGSCNLYFFLVLDLMALVPDHLFMHLSTDTISSLNLLVSALNYNLYINSARLNYLSLLYSRNLPISHYFFYSTLPEIKLFFGTTEQKQPRLAYSLILKTV